MKLNNQIPWRVWLPALLVVSAAVLVIGFTQHGEKIVLWQPKQGAEKLVVPKHVNLSLTLMIGVDTDGNRTIDEGIFMLDSVVGSGCGVTGDLTLLTEVGPRDEKEVRITIIGHRAGKVTGWCQAIKSVRVKIPIEDTWLEDTGETRINFVLGGEENLYTLRKEGDDLIRLILIPISTINVISGSPGYNPPPDAEELETILNFYVHNERWYDEAQAENDWKLCNNIFESESHKDRCIEDVLESAPATD